jgi:hypothetical protein
VRFYRNDRDNGSASIHAGQGRTRGSKEAFMTAISSFMHALMRWIDDKFGEEYDPY